ncbi:MAG: spermidine/putrescine transport system ATP-binding protein [Epulopiscium sp.]|uniref:Spermidine/putrescine import ATP-binding protein PotA n=1 Tax=Defluviitalea raffinosedens TaxID=1450156 RepID=A0A7C8HFJ0_9FIRM|nr:spermidine/putrescine ABC transporter ATP-binding protein [Defluviitalea raffinosedens]MBZ4668708.1 spermidine/putrescine transporter ATPase subunit [Defluviitaleaceae bacterium]MDK2788723.1 spermidine/putrescine transport system ATP-binding protein [Candidatus Epulonipiscium sp.]KAE9634034.1 polyamine ABC transporter ATP-binding protein [Defluviitalea raffinosedens]MBM7685837.1 spermidine/putrescine transport system ATP-binding protein [Defluviitalea raffinosedens]HHW67975.1 ABC transporte
MSENIIELVDVSKSYGSTEVLKNINLYIRRNEFLTLLGPSGCGKTTTLRLIGGFEQPTKGNILFEGKNINSLPPYKRRVNTVFQKYALFSHMTVEENIAFGLKIKKLDPKVIKEKVHNILNLVNLSGYEKRSIDSLSGGQQQRIAIARALVNEPDVLLLDEPLGALDLKLRQDMQVELKRMQKQLGITFIYVTHDQEEALTMSDTIVVMKDGVIQQIGTPEDIYNEPKNAFVADFIGESNIIPGLMKKDYLVEFANTTFECVDKGFGTNQPVDVVIRPEDIEVGDENTGMLQGVVESVTFKGVHYEMMIKTDTFSWMVHSTSMRPPKSQVGLTILPYNIHIMKKAVD